MKKMLITIIASAIFCFGNIANAYVADGGTKKVESLMFGEDGSLFVAFSPAPVLCQGGNRFRMHARVLPSQPNHKELTSSLLTAYTSGATLRYIWVSHYGGTDVACSDSHYLQLHMIEFSPK